MNPSGPFTLFVDTSTGKSSILTVNRTLCRVAGFTEYTMRQERLPSAAMPPDVSDSGIVVDELILIPNTHINNLWHFLHHLFIAYKHMRSIGSSPRHMCLLFFERFFVRQGDITRSRYGEMLFRGLGFDEEQFSRIHNVFAGSKSITVERLTCAGEHLSFRSEPLFGEFRRDIREGFGIPSGGGEKPVGGRVTFIARKQSETRHIVNMEEVMAALASHNVRFVHMDDHSVEEQLRIASETDIMVGVHGAGLTWCVFMDAGSKLVEIYPGGANTDNYIRWCNIAGVRYSRLVADAVGENARDFRRANVRVPRKCIDDILTHITS